MPFTKIQAQTVRPDKTIEIVLYQLVGSPTMVVRPLTEANKPFWNDAIAQSGRQRLGRKNVTSEADVVAARAENRDTFVKYSLVDLHGFMDDEGVEGTMKQAREIVAAIPDDVFDKVMATVTNPDNFRDAPAPDVAAIAGK